MTNQDFSNRFDVGIASYDNNLYFDEYEKSVFLTKAQTELVISLYNGNNGTYQSFESNEEIRKYLRPLISGTRKSLIYKNDNLTRIKYDNYYTYKVSDGEISMLGIIYEEVRLDDDSLGCMKDKVLPVIPVRHDELIYTLSDPFKCPNKNRVLRVDNHASEGTRIELISKYKLLETNGYYFRYVSYPKPIVLVDLDDDLSVDDIKTKNECKLPESLHQRILDRAIQLAIQSKLKSNNNVQ